MCGDEEMVGRVFPVEGLVNKKSWAGRTYSTLNKLLQFGWQLRNEWDEWLRKSLEARILERTSSLI